MIEEISIPEERKPVLIGKDGSVKDELEGTTGTKISISDGVIVEGRSSVDAPSSATAITRATRFDGTAKPIPLEPPERLMIEVLIPISRPAMSIRPPPELPGFIAASVWMKYPF